MSTDSRRTLHVIVFGPTHPTIYTVNPVESALSSAFDRLEVKWKNPRRRIGP
ncbi:hypothetical protein [Streptomyces katrae]|uniref:hypothetical protein n=1 Tax=Streptomyces katrae TaxID=68223 RepID=UPI00131DBE0B|nr:hypothetical protein [Streptomyces katrae]